MNNLDDITVIKSLDSSNSLDSINYLSDQCEQAWEEINKLTIPETYQKVDNIVIAGMGGSTYGARLVKSLYDGASFAKVPIEIANNYWLPGYVGSNSLVILSSYSGNTEETLSVGRQAEVKKAKIVGLTSGGQLANFLQRSHYPGYIFKPIYNPCKQPRIGVGYMVMGLIGILAKLKKIPVGNLEVKKLSAFLREKNKFMSYECLLAKNPAKQLASRLKEKIPVFIVADFLDGAAYAVRNPFHETAKQFGLYFTIPELNHHLLEGLSFPGKLKEFLLFIFVESNIYDNRNKKRLELTQEIVEKNHFNTENIRLEGNTALTQAMEFIQIGAWVTFYLAILNNVNPAKIPWVDFFKAKLKGENYEI